MLSTDDTLAQRFNKAFNEFVKDLVSFKVTSLSNVYNDVQSAELLLVDPKTTGLDIKRLPKDCAYAWFTESQNSKKDSMFYVYLYQNVFEICKCLMKVIENYRHQLVFKSDFFQNSKVVSFMSCGGKTGASTVAEGLAYNKSQSDLSVMYVVLSVFGKADLLEKRADSITYLEDIHNLSTDSNPERLKLINGFKEISTALSFKPSTLSELVKKAKVQEYDYIVIDTDFNYVTLIPEVLKLSNDVVLVTDGSSNSIADLEKAHEYVFNTDFQYDKKIKVIHNRYTESYRSDSLVYNEKLSTTIDELSKNFTLAEVFNAMSTINL